MIDKIYDRYYSSERKKADGMINCQMRADFFHQWYFTCDDSEYFAKLRKFETDNFPIFTQIKR